MQAPRKRSGSNSPRSNGFTIVLFGPLLALVHATRAEALFLLEPYGRGLDLSLAADHHLHRASDAEEAVLCFCTHRSSDPMERTTPPGVGLSQSVFRADIRKIAK